MMAMVHAVLTIEPISADEMKIERGGSTKDLLFASIV